MGQLQVTAQPKHIRVSVALTSTGDALHATERNLLTAAIQHVIPAASLEYVYIVLAVAVDNVGFNKFFVEHYVVADHAALGVNKGFLETQTVTDETTYVLFKKGAIEALHTTEAKSFAIAKQLADVVDATDDFMGTANLDDEQVMVFSKAMAVEQQTVADVARVTAGKRVVDPVGSSEQQTFEVDKGLTENLGTTEVRTTSLEKVLADSVDAGDEFNAVATTDDGEVMVFGKRLAETFTQVDEVSVQAEKGFEDLAGVATDQIDFIEVGKGVEDAPQTTEMLAFDTSKSLDDEAVTTEQLAIGFAFGVADRAYYGDGPNLYDTYALSYFGEEYVLEGFPTISFTKDIADLVHTTDDFFGAANTDDDETMQFGKTLGEVALTADAAQVTFSKPLADLLAKSDSTQISLSKALADTFGKSDLAIKATDKVFSDSKTTSDAATQNTGKGIGDDANTAEYNSFAFTKKLNDTVITTDDFLGNANADDDETMLFQKMVSDSFTKSDLAVKTAGKGLADLASTSESGSIVWTDYWPIGYTETTSSVYVGNSQTF